MAEPGARRSPVGTSPPLSSAQFGWVPGSSHLLRSAALLVMFGAGVASTIAWQGLVPRQPRQNAAGNANDDGAPTLTRRVELDDSADQEFPESTVTGPTAAASAKVLTNAGQPSPQSPDSLAPDSLAPRSLAHERELRARGRTESAPGRLARLPLATSQPVAFVDVRIGDRVEKGWQVFSHWESPERLQMVKTEVERAQKNHESAKMRYVAAAENARRYEAAGATISAARREVATTAAKLRKLELETAELTLREAEQRFTATEFEFSQAFVTSPIAGIVTQVNVVPGDRRQPGTGLRGVEVLDASVLMCRCLLSVEELTALNGWAKPMGSPASSAPTSQWSVEIVSQQQQWPARVASVGIQAEGNSGLIPVLLEVENPELNLLCNIEVDVVFRPRDEDLGGSAQQPAQQPEPAAEFTPE